MNKIISASETQPTTLSRKTVFVTGATGFLGGALTRRLAGDGAKVRGLARDPDRFPPDTDGIEIVQGDITDGRRMRDVIQECEIVFHTAAVASGPLEMQHQVNVEGTYNVLCAAAETGVERVVHVSSAGVYGFRQRDELTEATPLEPGHAAYGVTKAEAEDVVQTIAREHKLDYSILRPGMIYGPGSQVWTATMFRIARRNPTVFIGDGSGSIQAIHVDDVVDLMTVLAIHPAAAGETFNCTPEPPPTWREFLGTYAALVGHNRWLGIPPAPIRLAARVVAAFAPRDTRLKDLPLVIEFLTSYRRYRMDKARNLLGWQPKIGLREGIQRCIPYLREQGLLR